MKLSSNSVGVYVGSPLYCIEHFPCSVKFQCMLGGSVEVWTKNSLHWHAKGCKNKFGPQRPK